MMETRILRVKATFFSVATLGLFCFCISASVFAQAQQEDSPALLRKALEVGEIDSETYLVHRIQSTFVPETLPAKFVSPVKPKPSREYTLLVKEIRLKWDTFSEETRYKLKPFLLRPTDSSYMVWGIDMAYTVSEATPYDTAHFRIHYVASTDDAPDTTDSDSDGVPDYVESMGTEFENVYSTEITAMGYTVPPGDGTEGGNSKFDVYIKNIGGYGIYGWADPEGSSSGSSWYSFMVMDDDYSNAEFPTNTPLENMQVTAAHEFHHSVQFGYNVYTDTWLMEATSTWIEDEVYDSVNDNLQYLANDSGGNLAWFKRPQASLNLETDGWHWYGSWIWNRCISERHGRDIVREIWDGCKTKSSLVAVSDVLSSKGTNLTDAFVDFTARNYTKVRRYVNSATIGEPYEEGSTYPNIKIENSASPHSSYPVPTQNKLIDNLASRYFKFVPQSGASAKTLEISFNGPNGKDCGAVVIFETKDGRKIEKRITLDASKDGTAIVSGFGTNVRNYADVDSAILIMDNATQADDGLQFSYSAQYLTGSDPQITPWGWGWGYRPPFWQSPDIWVDNDGDGIKDEPADPVTGQEAEPSIGKVNKLYAKVRNLGSSSVTDVLVEFSYIPAGIGATDYLDIDSETVNLGVGATAEQDIQVDWDLTNLNEDNGGKWPKPIKDHDHFCVKVTLQSTGDLNTDNNLAKNNFVNVPVVTYPSPKTVYLDFIMANPEESTVEAGLIMSPPLSKDWTVEFEGLREYSSFSMQPNEQRVVTMMLTPPKIDVEGEDRYSEQLVDISGHIDGEIIGGISYNLILTEEKEEEEELGPLNVSLHLGGAIPIGDLADSYDPGFNVIVDVDYYLVPQISLVGLFGYNNLKDEADESFYWLNLSGNARYYYLARDRYKCFLGAGPGVYIPQEGDTEFGVNVGTGIDFRINRRFSVEAGGDYHTAFDGDTSFLHFHAGLVFNLPF